ncbi:MAG: SusD/RagB family nutrient-binding outer membrane lipoprotein [Saprospiraceae bacterium]|nr:SusD/RagB family nutrient-binding outer membrane lipoprotein [Saprospiraceae bacterium]HMW39751.1 SusD/RagB family nutrient-binding outer membrane lipoprotein [Saprospiraceae bacterium]HMX89108.1 SusD/RagB family nutrient-binding outer membrane lipoprotein [Saprospiraceae bacterium]HMZ41106.1 SusD/RagB family nutrient-binding outer membrane lipoprotein [Saprospiraceae bacterium]HNA63440.1 SusD/RagB family nutrient-binding outer membrane lipoprotein [Saprospiraceae bacterium]
MKKFAFIFLLLLVSQSCSDDFDSLNKDSKNPTNVPAGFLFAASARQVSDLMHNSNVNFNIFRLLAQYWTECTYIDESNYDLTTRNIPQNYWNSMYARVLKNLDDCKGKVNADGLLDPAVKKNQIACIEILNVYTWSNLVNSFGNIPYSKALNSDDLYPAYDDAKTIYADLMKRLDAAIASISASDGFGSSDVLLSGDMGRWSKFANSLKMRLAITLADVDATTAKAAIAAANAGALQFGDDDIDMHYESATPNTNPIWVDLVQSGRKDFVAANTMVDLMNGLSDPRVFLYFTTDAAGGYSGGIYGSLNNYATFSKPSTAITAPDASATWISTSEVEFIRAEAIERGFLTGNAADNYNNGIKSSVLAWGGTVADADKYIADAKVAYATAAGDYKQKIGTQKWIALYNQGFIGWTEWRRLDYPVLNVPTGTPGTTYNDIPRRLTYPVQEQTINAANYGSASSAIGGDKVQTKLFWDIH